MMLRAGGQYELCRMLELIWLERLWQQGGGAKSFARRRRAEQKIRTIGFPFRRLSCLIEIVPDTVTHAPAMAIGIRKMRQMVSWSDCLLCLPKLPQRFLPTPLFTFYLSDRHLCIFAPPRAATHKSAV